MTYQLHHGNMLDILPMMERDSIDAIVTDPPYGLDFMGKDWDHGVPGEHFWREAWRVAKPGAHLLAFGGTRTFHRLACAIEDAGWEIRDCVMWVYGQGFPKSHDVSKAIDREAGAEREVVGEYVWPDGNPRNTATHTTKRHGKFGDIKTDDSLNDRSITQPATPAAVEWDGWGTALKPAWEPIIVARKPLQGTVAENVQRYGTGAMNVDACRIETAQDDQNIRNNASVDNSLDGATYNLKKQQRNATLQQGRWPANLIHDGSAEVLAGFPNLGNASNPRGSTSWSKGIGKINNAGWQRPAHEGYQPTDSTGYGDTGSAARFFYCAKASKQDRDEGCEGLNEASTQEYGTIRTNRGAGYDEASKAHNHHPTVKPTSLMRYLCRLVTPPQGVILDPFMGSGSTGKAAILEGFNFIGVDIQIEYVEIAARRIEHACGKVGIVIEQPMMFESRRETVDRPKQLILL